MALLVPARGAAVALAASSRLGQIMRVMKRGRVGALALALALLVGTGGAAQAALGLKSERGWGYSQDHNGRKQVKACDTKGDGHPVYAQFKRTGSGTTYYVEDNDGANNGWVCCTDR